VHSNWESEVNGIIPGNHKILKPLTRKKWCEPDLDGADKSWQSLERAKDLGEQKGARSDIEESDTYVGAHGDFDEGQP